MLHCRRLMDMAREIAEGKVFLLEDQMHRNFLQLEEVR